MLGKLLVLFVLLPLIEMALLIRLGDLLGFWPTFGLVVATGAVGAVLARVQGTRAFHAIRTELASHRMPAAAMLDGLMILIGAVVLITPGILTDLLGIALLVPFTRRAIRSSVSRRLERMVRRGEIEFVGFIR